MPNSPLSEPKLQFFATIECRYSCRECQLSDVPVRVRAREEGDDLIEWMHKVFEPAIGAHHYSISPHCKTKTLADVKIPVGGPNKDMVGGATPQ